MLHRNFQIRKKKKKVEKKTMYNYFPRFTPILDQSRNRVHWIGLKDDMKVVAEQEEIKFREQLELADQHHMADMYHYQTLQMLNYELRDYYNATSNEFVSSHDGSNGTSSSSIGNESDHMISFDEETDYNNTKNEFQNSNMKHVPANDNSNGLDFPLNS